MKRDGAILGWGVAACSWLAFRFSAGVTVELKEDGTARAICATQDIGTGIYTVMAQLVGDRTGIPVEKIDVILGDTNLPAGPTSGGSATIASVIPAVLQAVRNAIDAVLSLAVNIPNSPFARRKPDDLAFSNGLVHLKDGPPEDGVRFERLIEMSGASVVSGRGKAEGGFDDPVHFNVGESR